MPWNFNEPDPLKEQRRRLDEQQRELTARARQLREEIAPGPDGKPRVEPPVWRDDGHNDRAAEPTPARKRHLARQRQRDMALAFILVFVLLVVVAILLWVAYVHNTATVRGA